MGADLTPMIGILPQWVEEHRVVNRTIETFWLCVEGYQRENAAECLRVFGEETLDPMEFTVTVTKVSVTANDWPTCGYAYVTAFVPIVYRGRDMGMYRAVFTLDGEDEDDYFTVDPMPSP